MTAAPRHRTAGCVTSWPARARDERGEITSTTLIFPVLLVVILMSVQFALAYHAKSVATAAAQDGARAAQAEDGTVDAGRAEAVSFVADNASRLLRDVTVTVDADNDTVHVEVQGYVAGVVPGLEMHVTGVADGPVERFRNETER